MPIRLTALSPGVFMRDHLDRVGGIDYPQNIYREYKRYLKGQGVRHILSHGTMSTYIWMANKMGLIIFDHADSPERWGSVHDGANVRTGYRRSNRPLAPSPRHYYRLVSATDPRWDRLGTSYRVSIGYPAPPARVAVPPRERPKRVRKPLRERKPEVEAAPPEVKAKPKRERKPRVPRVPMVPAVLVTYQSRVDREIIPLLDELGRSASMVTIDQLESRLLDLADEVVTAAGATKGDERKKLLSINISLLRALEHIGPLRSSLTAISTEKLATRIAAARASYTATLRVIREDVVG